MEQETKKNSLSNLLLLTLLLTNIFLIILMIFTISNLNNSKSNSSDELNNDIPIFEETQDEECKEIYRLKDYNGKIGIYKNDSLVYTLDVYIFTLPEEDKKLLTEGVEVSNKEELYDLIEIYY